MNTKPLCPIAFAALTSLSVLALAGCGSDNGDHLIDSGVFDGSMIDGGPRPDGSINDGGPPACDIQPTFTSIYSVVFGTVTCAVGGCHAPTFLGGLDMMTGGKDGAYMALVNANTFCMSPCNGAKADFPKRVVPSHPEQSFLYEKLFSPNPDNGKGGSRMPLTSLTGLMPACEIDVIKQWIMDGAQNN